MGGPHRREKHQRRSEKKGFKTFLGRWGGIRGGSGRRTFWGGKPRHGRKKAVGLGGGGVYQKSERKRHQNTKKRGQREKTNREWGVAARSSSRDLQVKRGGVERGGGKNQRVSKEILKKALGAGETCWNGSRKEEKRGGGREVERKKKTISEGYFAKEGKEFFVDQGRGKAQRDRIKTKKKNPRTPKTDINTSLHNDFNGDVIRKKLGESLKKGKSSKTTRKNNGGMKSFTHRGKKARDKT